MATGGRITPNENGTVRYTAVTPCIVCGVPVAVDQLDREAVLAWQDGAMVQDAFPGMSDGEREALATGTHSECFELLFPEDGKSA